MLQYIKCVEPLARSQVTPAGGEATGIHSHLRRKPMSDVELSGLMSVHRKNRRAQRELAHHQKNELQTKSWIREDKSGRCYTYRGVQYCY